MENGLQDIWCRDRGLPPYRGLLHILAPQKTNWRTQISKLSKHPEHLFDKNDKSEFSGLRIFSLKNRPFATDQANEEMIKPFKNKFSQQSLVNIEPLTWKVVGHLNKQITFPLIEKLRPPKYQLFYNFTDPFKHSGIRKKDKPTAKNSLNQKGEKNIHSNFFPLWKQSEWDRMKRNKTLE